MRHIYEMAAGKVVSQERLRLSTGIYDIAGRREPQIAEQYREAAAALRDAAAVANSLHAEEKKTRGAKPDRIAKIAKAQELEAFIRSHQNWLRMEEERKNKEWQERQREASDRSNWRIDRHP